MKKSTIVNISLLLVTMCVICILLEFCFRVFLPQPTYAVEYAPWGWKHIPNVSFVHGAERGREFVTRIHYNKNGIRDSRDFPYEKPAGTYRIQVYGDSYAEGVEVPETKNLSHLLEAMLNDRPPVSGLRYEVMNFGVYAYDTAQEYMYFKYDGSAYRPDLVIVLYTMDDPQNLQRGFLQLKDGKLEEHPLVVSDRQRVMRFIRGYIKSHFHLLTFIINRLSFMSPGAFVKDGAKINLVHDLPYRTTHDDLQAQLSGEYWKLTGAIFKAFKAEAAHNGSDLMIVSSHIDPVEFRDAVDMRRQFCKENDIYFLVSYDFGGQDRFMYHYALDGHWNTAGHERMARLIYDMLVADGIVRKRSENAV